MVRKYRFKMTRARFLIWLLCPWHPLVEADAVVCAMDGNMVEAANTSDLRKVLAMNKGESSRLERAVMIVEQEISFRIRTGEMERNSVPQVVWLRYEERYEKSTKVERYEVEFNHQDI